MTIDGQYLDITPVSTVIDDPGEIMSPPAALPYRLQELGQRVWALPVAREILFREAQGKDRVTALLLSKDTFVEAAKGIYETFDHEKYKKLRDDIISLSRHRLYLSCVRRLSFLICHEDNEHFYAADESLKEILGLYPNVKELFWDRCQHPYTLLLPTEEQALQRPQATLLLHGHPMIRCYDTDDDDRPIVIRNREPPTATIHPDYSCIPRYLPDSWRLDIVEDPDPLDPNTPSFRLPAITPSKFDTLARHAAIEVISRIDDDELRALLHKRSLVPGARPLVRFAAQTDVYKMSPVELEALHTNTMKELRLRPQDGCSRPMRGFGSVALDIHEFLVRANHGRPSAFSASDILELHLTHPALAPLEWDVSQQTLRRLLGLDPPSTQESEIKPLSPCPTPPTALHPEMPRGKMSELILHIYTPLSMWNIAEAEQDAIASRIADLTELDETMTRALLHIGGPECRYVLEADISVYSRTWRTITIISERLMQSFNDHRRRIEASQEERADAEDIGKGKGVKRRRESSPETRVCSAEDADNLG